MSHEVVISWSCELDPTLYSIKSRKLNITDVNLSHLITGVESTYSSTLSSFVINNTNYKICVYETCDYNYLIVAEPKNVILDVSQDDVGIIIFPTEFEISQFKQFINRYKLFGESGEFQQHYIITSRDDGDWHSD